MILISVAKVINRHAKHVIFVCQVPILIHIINKTKLQDYVNFMQQYHLTPLVSDVFIMNLFYLAINCRKHLLSFQK